MAVVTIYCGGLTNAGAFDTAQRVIVAQTPKKVIGEGEGVIKGVDASERKLLISHGPISGFAAPPPNTRPRSTQN